MALSNMRREPQREITESVIGIALFVGLATGDYFLSRYIDFTIFKEKNVVGIIILMILIPIALFILSGVTFALLYFTHHIGEEICGWLADRGWDPRPRDRK